ncbi:MAG: autotransporter outer membrane beta-barrel domain-containing protein [Rhodanobacter sp.]
MPTSGSWTSPPGGCATGRDFRAGQTWLTPFGAVSFAALRGAGFTELGNTGFEMIAQPSFQQRTTAMAGLRLGRDWHWSGTRWAQLNLSAGYMQVVDARDDAQAAFTGAPGVRFALNGLPLQRVSGWLQMNLGVGGERLAWQLSYDRQANDEAMSLGMKLQF